MLRQKSNLTGFLRSPKLCKGIDVNFADILLLAMPHQLVMVSDQYVGEQFSHTSYTGPLVTFLN